MSNQDQASPLPVSLREDAIEWFARFVDTVRAGNPWYLSGADDVATLETLLAALRTSTPVEREPDAWIVDALWHGRWEPCMNDGRRLLTEAEADRWMHPTTPSTVLHRKRAVYFDTPPALTTQHTGGEQSSESVRRVQESEQV